jgi:hypothetical protein
MKRLMQGNQPSLCAGLIVGYMVCTVMGTFAEEGEWIRKADMPTGRFGASVAEINGKLFVVGGSQSSTSILATVEVYDPSTDSWTARADMPTARKNTAAAVVNGIIYVFGGTQIHQNGSIRTAEAYDPATDTWTTKQDMPTARSGLAAIPLNGKIYAIGGWGVSAFESVVEVYDPATDTWEDKARMPLAYGNFGFASMNGRIYLFGGATTSGMRMDTREYDPVTDSWTSKAVMPIARVYPSASVLDGRVYVMGGSSITGGNRTPTSRVDIYDPVTDGWENGVDLPTARGDLASETVNGKTYAIGGHTGITWGDAGTVYATVEQFALPQAEAKLAVQAAVLLSWKQSGTSYVVESASSPEGPWTAVVDAESRAVGDEVHMTVVQSRDAQFFRLSDIPLE